MKLQHYLGGLEGLEPISLETRVFVEAWEERIFGIHTAMMALSPQLDLEMTSSTFNTVWTWADLRKGAESMNPFDYFKFRYYEKWLGGISRYFVEKGYITQAELDERTQGFLSSSSAVPERGDPKVDARVRKYLLIGDDPKRERAAPPRFTRGDAVKIADPKSIEHTRLPGHLRNKLGIVDSVYPDAYTYLCDTGPDGIGGAMTVYCVEFDPQDLWPGNTETNFSFYADLFEAYLEPTTAS
ncbi:MULTISPECIES: nitrile hydratase subunit beta [unclassified Bradyrhizobium]|uniref:nitrile hydratase subunit beta n=1 Tax=unclassified Bradyrhizobium TaxID=2631580 RepID=UPI001FF7B0CA|nr:MULTISPECIES: nitrile hydratase subunit beta [unclassified Bradyrhizobium]MCK1539841.1 nitrile hydratase subunit beta [Bradyrhizobium sp. 176]MCK1560346.1 nitrile hydratase subunit beta [Bradyrhizobium sp. 171]